MNYKRIFLLVLTTLLVSCSAVRYVPKDSSLLYRNKLVIESQNKRETKAISSSEVKNYIQQRPNRRLLGMGIYLGFYNITDSSKHDGWHRFWGTKIGEAPVVLDSSMIKKSKREIEVFLDSKGFLSSTVSSEIEVSPRRKATVKYTVNLGRAYRISSVKYNIADTYIRPLVMADSALWGLKSGEIFERKDFENERTRITSMLRDRGFWGFNASYITYTVDSNHRNNTLDVELLLRPLTTTTPSGQAMSENHPIYSIDQVQVMSDYNPAQSLEAVKGEDIDTICYQGVDIMYKKKLYIRPDIILGALGVTPGDRYDQKRIEEAYNAVRSLGYSANFLFTPLGPTQPPTAWDTAANGAITARRKLACLVQCTPNVRQGISTDFEASTTSNYYSLALTLGYQNRNLFRGGEDFNLSFRGAYEFAKPKEQGNAFEFGVTTSLALPRFLLPISDDKMRKFKYSSTKFTVSYNIQNRPFYRRSLVSAVYGYGWTLKNGARFTINPADINVVSVPWIDEIFLLTIENPYLRNSYSSQLIAGLSASYFYNTNADIKQNGFTFRVSGDANGNLFRLITSAFCNQVEKDGESYYNIFGLRYAQYFRLSADVSNRINVGRRSQIAWRFLLAGGYAYGNSRTLPFERLFFAGGSNSMRGWQVRTLGPGSVRIDDLGSYPNQLGDMRLEANFEYRVNVAGGFGLALFLDCGNVWMNGIGEKREEAKFHFNTFFRQLALNTGVGLRYDAGYFLVRLDWGVKLHDPNVPVGRRWGCQRGINDTALQFALGLPF
ncbi:MAG: BamA/TamA family outer membrane protein [Mucinivorans sp.]